MKQAEATESSTSGPRRRGQGLRPSAFRIPGIQRFSALYLLALIFAIFSLWIPDLFLSSTTIRAVSSEQVTVAILAIALLIPLTADVFDLSVGSVAALALVIIAKLQENDVMNIWLSCIVAVLACCAVGWFNGFLVVTLKVNSFITTLGTSQVLIAIALYLSKNQGINSVFSPGFLKTGQSVVFGIPIVFIYLLVIGGVVYYVLEWTRVGRNLFATGANVEAARLSGVRTDRLIYGSFVSSAAVSSLAGILYGAQVGAFSNSFASAYLFPAFAAVFLGATQFNRRPNVWGTVLAVYTLAFGAKGLQLSISDAQYWVGPMFNGVALIIAVALAASRLSGGGGPNKLRRKFSRRRAEDAVALENQVDAGESSPDGARKEIDRTSA